MNMARDSKNRRRKPRRVTLIHPTMSSLLIDGEVSIAFRSGGTRRVTLVLDSITAQELVNEIVLWLPHMKSRYQ